MAKDQWCEKHSTILDDFASGSMGLDAFKIEMKDLGFTDDEITSEVEEIKLNNITH